MNRRSWVLTAVCGLIPAVMLATLIAVPAVVWSRLPGRLGDHWKFAGTVNGSAVRPVPFLYSGMFAVIGTAILWWVAFRNRRQAVAAPRRRSLTSARFLSAGMLLTGLGTSGSVVITVANAGVRDWREASVGPFGLPTMIAGIFALAAVSGWVCRRYAGLGTADDETPRMSLGLSQTEQAFWAGWARASWAIAVGVTLIAAGVVVALTVSWQAAVPACIVGVLLLGFTQVRVTASRQGVSVAYGALGLTFTKIPLQRIVRAEAIDFRNFTFGYRGSLTFFGSATVALRRGPALSLILREGKGFVVTVDDAATAAALLNDVLGKTAAPSS